MPLSENAGTLNQQLEACRSMPQRAKIFLGTIGACSHLSLRCLSTTRRVCNIHLAQYVSTRTGLF